MKIATPHLFILKGKQMNTYAYDIECFKNLFTATFVNIEDEKDVLVFYIGLDIKEHADFKKFLESEMVLVGYNNHSYDDPMLRYVLEYRGDNIVKALYELSGKLIDDNFKRDKALLSLRYPKTMLYSWNSIDLMKILAFDRMGISLKQTAINLKWHKIQDIPLSPSGNITNHEQLKLVLDYNMNDVLITKRLYEEIEPLRVFREELGKLYNIDFSSASDSKIANLILESTYTKELKRDIRSIKDGRTQREKVFLKDCLAQFIEFNSPQLIELFDRIRATVVYYYNNFRYGETLKFANCTFSLGVGGLHTEDKPAIFVTDEDYIIRDMDVASYYPNLIINNKFYPKHLGEDFIRVLKRITKERLDAKRAGDKTKADGLKITVNSIFGKMASEVFWLYDPKQMLSTTVSGQLGLLMLVEDLYLNGIEVISANTDGVVCKIPRNLENKYYEIARKWEQKTKLELEFNDYKKYVRRDVNSYITEKEDGTTKEKGVFLKEVDLKKAYRMPIVAKALHAYFIEGKSVKETLRECNDIMEFCISQKSGSNFGIQLHTSKGIEKLQKTNRFYLSEEGGSLMKRELFTGKLTGLYVNQRVQILNDYDPNKPFEEYKVDYAFYEKEVYKTIDEIEPKQMSLFSFSHDDGKIIKAEMPKTKNPIEEKEHVPFEMNKLGKNQFAKKIESIVKQNEKIPSANPRYIYVENIDIREMYAMVYCLSKGVRKSFKLDKKMYKEQKIEEGQLLYCSKFIRINGEHILGEYRIVDKIEEEIPMLI